jgi:hypothetical protein
MPLPYENASTGKAAVAEMQKILQGFGASSFGIMEDFDAGEVIVQFKWRERQVTIKASIKGYANAWLKHHPYTSRMKCNLAAYHKKARDQANISVYSIIRDWIKGQITAVEIEMMSFENAFLGNIMLPSGETVMERITGPNGFLQLSKD